MKKQTSPGFHLVKNKGEFFWRLIAKNGKELARSSETYKSKKSCIDGLAATQIIFGGTNSFTDWTKKEPVTRPIVFP